MAIIVLSGVFLQLGGIGLLLQIAGMVAGLYLFVFAPVMAAAERRGFAESMSRGIRAARMPGAGNLLMAALYLIPSLALLLIPGKPGNLLGVNPSVAAWALVLVANLVHLGVLGHVRVPVPLHRRRRARRGPAPRPRRRERHAGAEPLLDSLRRRPTTVAGRRAHTYRDRIAGVPRREAGPGTG